MAEESIRPDSHVSHSVGNVVFNPSAPDHDHTATDIPMEQWLRLLIVISTVLALTLLVAVAVKLLSYLGHTLLIFSLGGLLAYALDPIVELARGNKESTAKRPSRARTTLVVFAGIVCIFVGACLALSKPMTHQVSSYWRPITLSMRRARERG